ncbi:hypothetical protein [Lebetimonas natsushimae]|uniref:hypothetical protein n=1 Tax=Lebetimonas natsushimae TaxID=1936991 RepID=UPI001EE69766|nr:hypothetical protein [Lebetimonas natsushimae]
MNVLMKRFNKNIHFDEFEVEYKEDETVLELLDRVKIIKDLVVDHSNLEEKIKKTKAWFIDAGKEIQYPEELKSMKSKLIVFYVIYVC